MLENLRFSDREEKNCRRFAKKLSLLADYYINEAFAVSHRNEASVSAIREYLPSYAGLHLTEEIKQLRLDIMNNNPKSFVTTIFKAMKEPEVPEFAEEKMLEIKAFEEKRFGYYKDTTAEETAIILREMYKIEKVTVGRDSGGRAVSVVPTPTTPSSQSGSGLAPTAPAATTSSPTVGTQVPAQGTSYKASATFEGSLSSVLNLTRLLDTTKRAIVVTKMNISRDEQTNKTVATINFSLPLASVSAANSSERVELTNAEIQALEELLVKLTIDASPTSQPTGRSNPFN